MEPSLMSVTQLPERRTYEPLELDRSLEAPDAAPPPTPGAAPRPAEWSVAKRVRFRFAFAYFVLYLIPFPITVIPGSWNPARYWGQLEQWMSLWTETHIFGLAKPVPIVP